MECASRSRSAFWSLESSTRWALSARRKRAKDEKRKSDGARQKFVGRVENSATKTLVANSSARAKKVARIPIKAFIKRKKKRSRKREIRLRKVRFCASISKRKSNRQFGRNVFKQGKRPWKTLRRRAVCGEHRVQNSQSVRQRGKRRKAPRGLQ